MQGIGAQSVGARSNALKANPPHAEAKGRPQLKLLAPAPRRMFEQIAPPQPTTTPPPGTSPTPDVSLLLRAHAERRWLSREVIPVVRQIETPEALPEEQLPAALAYLEVIWAEAVVRGHATDTARRLLDADGAGAQPLQARAHHDHRAVENLRRVVARRVSRLLAAPQPRAAV